VGSLSAAALVGLAVVALAILAGAGYQHAGTRRDAVRYPPPGRLIDVGRGRLHLHTQGAGPSVVLDAGIAASSVSWLHVAPLVARFARVHSYDRSGLAWSDRTQTRPTARSLAAELDILLGAAAAPPPYIVVAHSFGAFVAQAFAHLRPGAVAGLVLVDPIYPSEWLTLTGAAKRRLAGGVWLSRVGAVLASVGVVRLCLHLLARGSTGVPKRVSRLFGSEAASLIDRLVLQVRKLPPDAWPAMLAHWSRPKSFLAMADHLRGLERSAAEIAALGPRADIPVTVITAGLQPPGVRAEHARLAAAGRSGRHVVSEKAGHWVLIDDPEMVVAEIQRLVETLRLAGAGLVTPTEAPRPA
jgi:pimeloyl-ACP methyl ester carboxylesterase